MQNKQLPADGDTLKERVRECIEDFCRGPQNTNRAGERSWADPLVGFADGDDPLFERIRAHIGEFYWTPRGAFARAFYENPPQSLSVVSWVLPQTEATVREHGEQLRYPSEHWVRSRKYGEEFNHALHDHLVEVLARVGVRAAAPTHLPEWGKQVSSDWGLCTNWSHRHVAYVAGLGTFGLCDGLITSAGKAMRCGSVVMDAHVEPTPRAYDDIHAYCLYYARGTCGACMRRCPVDALSPERHDKAACREYVVNTTLPYGEEKFGIRAHACGLCQAGVPCESGIPAPLAPAGENDEDGDST